MGQHAKQATRARWLAEAKGAREKTIRTGNGSFTNLLIIIVSFANLQTLFEGLMTSVRMDNTCGDLIKLCCFLPQTAKCAEEVV